MEEEFIVSARKYRPITFDDVVGQIHITGTLKNAIRMNKVAHAFLFCGPRGVGKTTCARILAKTLNCMSLSEDLDPCNKCESCTGFNENHSFNIHELDAASNNGVENIRDLIDKVRVLPQIGKYSVYIVDEVHMLSTSAFNAFLKTLEEPPPHAIFILATTEKHKILPTILSRCQVFDFNRITIDDIASHLANIALKENIEAEYSGLQIIAQKADGALRDALSIFDRVVSYSGNKMTYQDVITNLNVLDYDYYFKIADALYNEDFKQSLLIFNEILSHGFEGQYFLNGLSEHFRNLLLANDTVTVDMLDVSDNVKEKYVAQSKVFKAAQLIEILKITNESDVKYRTSNNKRLLVELTLLQIADLKKKD